MNTNETIHLQKLHQEWDPTNRQSALNAIADATAKGDILTGLLFIDTESQELHETIDTVKTPMNRLTEKHLCPGNAVLADINQSLR